jgi:hypothetical protein
MKSSGNVEFSLPQVLHGNSYFRNQSKLAFELKKIYKCINLKVRLTPHFIDE